MRKNPFFIGQVHHVFNKSIAEYEIFNSDSEFQRMVKAINYYKIKNPDIKLSRFIKHEKQNNSENAALAAKNRLVQIIAYCIMPTHLHLVLKQIEENGISIFMSNILNSYARYFNIRHNRKGPLWEGRFRNVAVESDEQLLHLTRYVHLNPVTAHLVDKPESWQASSYLEYLGVRNKKMCDFNDILEIKPVSYKVFVEDRISYQRELSLIKSFLLEKSSHSTYEVEQGGA